MTEYNYFCWSEEYDDDNSFQQPRYRVFNVEVSKKKYSNLGKIYNELDFDVNENETTRFQTAFKNIWNELSKEEKQKYFDIPNFDWEGFTFITGIEEECKETITIGNNTYDKNEVENALKDVKSLN